MSWQLSESAEVLPVLPLTPGRPADLVYWLGEHQLPAWGCLGRVGLEIGFSLSSSFPAGSGTQ